MRHDRPGGISDAGAVAVIGAVVALGAFIWLWGGLAGVIFGTGWLHVAPDQLIEVLVRLPTRLPDPAAAWPAADHGADRRRPAGRPARWCAVGEGW